VYLNIVLRNLVTYAIRLSNNNNTLTLRSGLRNDKAYFEIVNKTNGIPSSQMEGYFNKLKEFKSSDLQQDYGQGLGLSIAKMLTEKMEGYISYATSPDLGYEFSVQFKINT